MPGLVPDQLLSIRHEDVYDFKDSSREYSWLHQWVWRQRRELFQHWL